MANNEQTLKLEHHVFEPQLHVGLPDIVMLHGICAGAWVFPEVFIEPLLMILAATKYLTLEIIILLN